MDFVKVELEDGVAVLTVDRQEKLNALDGRVVEEIGQALLELEVEAPLAIIVTGAGERAFIAGADIRAMSVMDPLEAKRFSEIGHAAMALLDRSPIPTIAAVNGYALGGGCEVALACDFRVAADDARLGQPEILLGIIPGAGGTQRLARLVGPARAKDLVFSGRMVSADEALAIGLVDEVVPAAEVHAAARARLARYVGGPAYALRAAKEAIDRGLEVDLESGLELERMLFAGTFATKDRAVGMRHFVEKGKGPAPFEGA